MSLLSPLAGPWRAVPVLGAAQIITWGALFYPPVLTVPLIAAERGWSFAFAMGGFSFAQLVGGLVAPRIGALIDRHGGHRVMPVGAIAAAAGLLALVATDHPVLYLAVWGVLGGAMAATLYDPAFASLGRIFGAEARRPITLLTLIGGFASTVSWPVTYALLGALGWRGTFLVYAAALALVAAPLLAFALPRGRAEPKPPAGNAEPGLPQLLPAHGFAFVVVVAAFAAYAFVPSALSAHMIAIFGRLGVDAGTAILIGALFGPAQVAARIGELLFARSVHPLFVARFAIGLMLLAFLLLYAFGASPQAAAAFAVLFGACNGLMTIARGAVPLSLYGPVGFGRTVGRIAGPSLFLQAIAPLTVAFAIERTSDTGALALIGLITALSLLAFLAVRRR